MDGPRPVLVHCALSLLWFGFLNLPTSSRVRLHPSGTSVVARFFLRPCVCVCVCVWISRISMCVCVCARRPDWEEDKVQHRRRADADAAGPSPQDYHAMILLLFMLLSLWMFVLSLCSMLVLLLMLMLLKLFKLNTSVNTLKCLIRSKDEVMFLCNQLSYRRRAVSKPC